MKTTLLLFFNFLSSAAFAKIIVNSPHSDEIWSSIDIVQNIEGVPIIKTSENKGYFLIDHVACAFENYNACSFFSEVNGQRKMLVATTGTAKLMNELAAAGVPVDEENSRIYASSINCEKDLESLRCEIQE